MKCGICDEEIGIDGLDLCVPCQSQLPASLMRYLQEEKQPPKPYRPRPSKALLLSIVEGVLIALVLVSAWVRRVVQ